MARKEHQLRVFERLREDALADRHFELPSGLRAQLADGARTSAVHDATFDSRHRPLSVDRDEYFTNMKHLARRKHVKLQEFMQLKRSSGSTPRKAPPAVLVVVDNSSLLSLHSLDGDVLLNDFDLGHEAGRRVIHMVLSPGQENHFVATADDSGEVRLHSLRIVARREVEKSNSSEETTKESVFASDEKKASRWNETGKQSTKRVRHKLVAYANITSSFRLWREAVADIRRVTALVPVIRGSGQEPFICAGDSLGSVSVFYANGTLKGRVRVVDDDGGIVGMRRAQGLSVLFYSSKQFGFLSVSQLDLQYPHCYGWHSPAIDVAEDLTTTYATVLVSLADGDILSFATSSGKSKACDLTFKFPHIASAPLKLYKLRGHLLAVPLPHYQLNGTHGSDHLNRGVHGDILVFGQAAVEAGFDAAPSLALALQASFRPRIVEDVSVVFVAGAGERATYVALRFEGQEGVELYELELGEAPIPPLKGPQEDPFKELFGFLNWAPAWLIYTFIGVLVVGLMILACIFQATKPPPPKAEEVAAAMSDPEVEEHLRKFRESMHGQSAGFS
eukprot:TRINITY_DN30217_c0_g1_i1.p1 TRINITY_DN30217_c0_g1~~TRINITY_DN30217_c0_g1_i1.p1  ORF type:complete len:647 (+),score=77.41 TRINITY_DN30217_c0_g1_i1:257-1942(+)